MSDTKRIEDASIEELRKEYGELTDRIFGTGRRPSEEDHDRRGRLWRELCRRVDVEQPECPACGARDWHFTDHTECGDCGYGVTEPELSAEIQEAWDSIAGRKGGDSI